MTRHSIATDELRGLLHDELALIARYDQVRAGLAEPSRSELARMERLHIEAVSWLREHIRRQGAGPRTPANRFGAIRPAPLLLGALLFAVLVAVLTLALFWGHMLLWLIPLAFSISALGLVHYLLWGRTVTGTSRRVRPSR